VNFARRQRSETSRRLDPLAATANFPEEVGIAHYGEPGEIAELMAFLVSQAPAG
jgi:hypothetical protein